MNLQEADILRTLYGKKFVNQRVLAETTRHSLGVVNRSLRALQQEGYLDDRMQPTKKAEEALDAAAPRRAIILAAGFGMRMVPINMSTPKALLEVNGERLIERLIRQLHEAGITDIAVVVGFMKDSFEYLMDDFGVDLICNSEYAVKNNLHSLALAADRIRNAYIVPCDIWCRSNPFSRHELYSWYMVADQMDAESTVRVNRKMELVKIQPSLHVSGGNRANRPTAEAVPQMTGGNQPQSGATQQMTGGTQPQSGATRQMSSFRRATGGNRMIGISYLMEPEAGTVREMLAVYDGSIRAARDAGSAGKGESDRGTTYSSKAYDGRNHDADFWEETLYRGDRMIVRAKVVSGSEFVEINTYEQLRDLDAGSDHLRSDAMRTIAEALGCEESEIGGISVLKKGMTNRSFLFSVRGQKYIMRIPGEGTDRLIDRRQEAEVFRTISGLGLCDDPVYINPENGYKITKFLEDVRVCDPQDLGEFRQRVQSGAAEHDGSGAVEHGEADKKTGRETDESDTGNRSSARETDVAKCMARLRAFHELHLEVAHTFNIFGQISFYESLWEGTPSIYRDYVRTRDNVFSLKAFLDSVEKDRCLTHIDAVPDNFLFYRQEDGSEGLQLTDWEYAGMQDPHVDIAMFCIYAMYDKRCVDRVIDLYFDGQTASDGRDGQMSSDERGGQTVSDGRGAQTNADGRCSRQTRAKIYCYIAACGLLWSNWCEYKRRFGVEFGEYSLRQYRYAKDYYRYAMELIGE